MAARKKPGPYTENPMDTMLRVRVDKITLGQLDECAKELGTSRSDIIRKGILKIYGELGKSKESGTKLQE